MTVDMRRETSISTAFVFVITFACIAAPISYLFYGSFRTDAPGSPRGGFTFANWVTVYGAERYQDALLNTVTLGTTVAVLSVLVGGALAWILARTDAPGR